MAIPKVSVLSRRHLIVLSATAASSILVAACGQAPVASPVGTTSSAAYVATTTAPAVSQAATTANTVASTTASVTPASTTASTAAASTAAATGSGAATSSAATASTAPPAISTAAAASTTVAPSAAPLAAGQNEITWSCYTLGEPTTTRWTDTLKAAAQATGVKVNMAWEAGATYWDKRQAEVAADSPNVDVMVNQLNWIVPGGLQGMFVDHNTYMQRDKVDPAQYYAADLASWAWKGKQWAMPMQSGGNAFFYNKEMFDAKGVPYPTKDWTYNDMLDVCRKLNDPKNNVWAIDIGQNSISYMMQTFIRAWGGQMLNDAKDRALYGSDSNSITGAGFDVDMINKYQLTPTDAARKTVPTGKAPMDVRMTAMEFNGFYRHTNLNQYLGAANLDYAPPPKGPVAQRAAVAGNGWSILLPSKVKDAAWTVLHWIHTPAGLVNTPQIQAVSWPPVISAASTPQWLDQFKGTHVTDVAAVWQTGGHDIIVVPEGDKAWSTMDKPIADARSGKLGIRDAMVQSADALNALFAQRPAAGK
jgi:multiple sugar transport system substrate-binding protein